VPSLRRAGRVIWLVTGLLALLAASSLVSMLVALVLAIRLLRETCRAPRPPRWVNRHSSMGLRAETLWRD
jgi:hypothetical protein